MEYKISIKAKDDFRSFKKDYEVIFDFNETKVNFLMGKNGCGKSTIIQAIRGTLNSNNDKDIRWAAKRNCKDVLEHFDINIEGFTNVYHLDVDGLDNNLSMFNASSATDLFDLGGLGMDRLSQGERTLIMITRLKEMVKDDENTLVIFDELDNHLDFDFRVKFVPWLNKLFPLSKKIIITHDLLMTNLSEGHIVYIMSKRNFENLNKCEVVGKKSFNYDDDLVKKVFFKAITDCEIKNITKKEENDCKSED